MVYWVLVIVYSTSAFAQMMNLFSLRRWRYHTGRGVSRAINGVPTPTLTLLVMSWRMERTMFCLGGVYATTMPACISKQDYEMRKCENGH